MGFISQLSFINRLCDAHHHVQINLLDQCDLSRIDLRRSSELVKLANIGSLQRFVHDADTIDELDGGFVLGCLMLGSHNEVLNMERWQRVMMPDGRLRT